MRKKLMRIVLGSVLLFGGAIFLTTQESEAIEMEYKLQTVLGADGCNYNFCTNSEGTNCDTAGSSWRFCPPNTQN